jgi:hypothetical protein
MRYCVVGRPWLVFTLRKKYAPVKEVENLGSFGLFIFV